MAIRQVIVTVSGGVADVHSAPDDIEVIIVDYDNLNDGDGTGTDSCLCWLGPQRCAICEDAAAEAQR